LDDVTVGYSRRPVIRGLSLDLPAASFGAVLGANGAGKTTLLRAILGRAQLLGGTIEAGGERVDRRSSAARVRSGLALVPEGRQVFSTLTVAENLDAGALGGGTWSERRRTASSILEQFPSLARRRDQSAGTLSGGEQQMLAIGRALMAKPSILLVDEASLGLAPIVTAQLFVHLERLSKEGTTVLAVEQNASILDHVDHVYVLDHGSLRIGGPVGDVIDRVRAEIVGAYLGDINHGGEVHA